MSFHMKLKMKVNGQDTAAISPTKTQEHQLIIIIIIAIILIISERLLNLLLLTTLIHNVNDAV